MNEITLVLTIIAAHLKLKE